MSKPKRGAAAKRRSMKRLPYYVELTGLGYDLMKGWAQTGKAPFIKIGRGWFAEEDEFDKWFQERKEASPYFTKKDDTKS